VKDGRYTEFGIVSFCHIFGSELGYPVTFTLVTSYMDWIAKKAGFMIA
jgi:secreted trypsin-like serine protease